MRARADARRNHGILAGIDVAFNKRSLTNNVFIYLQSLLRATPYRLIKRSVRPLCIYATCNLFATPDRAKQLNAFAKCNMLMTRG